MSHSQGGVGGGGFYSFPPPPNGFVDRTSDDQDKMRFHGFESSATAAVYDSAGLLSEIFDFGAARPAAPAELLGLVDQQNPQISGIHAGDSPMHLFLTNHQAGSPPPHNSTASHPLIPNHGFHEPQLTWIPEGSAAAAAAAGLTVEGQGLSLSLASSLEAAKAEELRMRTTAGGGGYGGSSSTSHEMMFFNATQEARVAAASSSNSYQQLHFGFGTTSSSVFSLAAVNVLRNSKFTRPAQELLEEFCSVGRGHHKKSNNNPTASTSGSGGGGGGSTTKDLPPLSPADRMEHQRRKVKLATMLDEVERRYRQYCEQMQMVVNSFDMATGFGAAVPYTVLAQKAMSRHFRSLKDGIQAELRRCCEVLGEKDVAGSGTGITKGETPRLKMLEQSLRKQRAFHQMGIMEQDAWRPQRGLPERSVNVLRAWLFEHFLHPYPSDADKHLLAHQTGLSRNQVANWFINARVRLWKPMIEEMYQQESNECDEEEEGAAQADGEEEDRESNRSAQTTTTPTTTTGVITSQQINDNDTSSLFISSSCYMRHHQLPTMTTAAISVVGTASNANAQVFTTTTTSYSHVDACNHFRTTGGVHVPADSSTTHHNYLDDHATAAASGVGPTMIRFGTTPISTTTGDVSLTLGLRHGDNTGFSFGDFGRSS